MLSTILVETGYKIINIIRIIQAIGRKIYTITPSHEIR